MAGAVIGKACAPQPQEVTEPSLAELARKQRAKDVDLKSQNIPLYTNDNIPKGPSGFGEIGSTSRSGAARSIEQQQGPEAGQKLAHLRYRLEQAQERLKLHQDELIVLQQRLGQKKVQYYPNPYETELQQFSRADINKLTTEIGQKNTQITEDQQAVAKLESEVRKVTAQWGWLEAGSQGRPLAQPPITAKPGTPAYWQARLRRARQQLSLAKEKLELVKNQLKLLQVQQIQTLNPNLQASLAGTISSKQSELSSDEDALRKAQRQVEEAQKALQAAPGSGGRSSQSPD